MKGHNSQIKKAVKLIDEAEQPVILAGHGIIFSGAYAELRELAEKAQIPVITTLLGISSFPDDHILCVGMPGMHGMAYASLAIEEADLLIALGMRFDDRITGKPSAFALKSKKIHIDIDPSEIGKNIEVDVPYRRRPEAGAEQVEPAGPGRIPIPIGSTASRSSRRNTLPTSFATPSSCFRS